MPNLRATLNAGDANRVDSALQTIKLGDLLNNLITSRTPTESSVTVTSNVATLANQPSSLFQVNVATVSGGSATGVKTLLKGPITGAGAIVPAAGQCVWDGGKKVLFATADLAATAHFTYATDADVTCSLLQRDIGERD